MSEVIDFCKTHGACSEGAKWASKYKTLAQVWANCERGDWMIWMLQRRGDVQQTTLVSLACECAEHVLHVYESKYPNDDRPRKAIEAARAWANDPSEAKKKLADAAYDAASDAAYDAYAYAAYAAAYAAATASDAAYASSASASDAAAYERKWQAERIREVYGAWNKEAVSSADHSRAERSS